MHISLSPIKTFDMVGDLGLYSIIFYSLFLLISSLILNQVVQ